MPAPAGELGSGENGRFDFSKLVTSSFVLWLPNPLFTLHPFDLLRLAGRLHLLLRF